MFRRTLAVIVLALMASMAANAWIWPLHHKKKNTNPLANLNSQQPDKVLFDRGEDALAHGKFDVARLTFQTLINTYPDSEYVARAKLGIGDAWYREGGTTALAQAEIEYKDFITFFPNMPEAAEAQLRVADIHYRQMEKPDRDYTHAKRAEEEYRQLILQFPDSKLVPQAEQRLREVQEVLAQREYDIGHFYYLRESYPAAIARLSTVADTYPLFSGADEALFLLGSSYEHAAENIRHARPNPKMMGGSKQAAQKVKELSEATKARMIKMYEDKAAATYARIITQYPISDRSDDAKHRLQEMGRKVPQPTQQSIAEAKKIEASRSEAGRFSRIMGTFRHAPDVHQAAKVGEPTLQDPAATSAVQVVREATAVASGANTTGSSTVTLQTLKPGDLESQPVPKSEAQPSPAPEAQPSTAPSAAPDSGSAAGAAQSPAQPAATDAGTQPSGSENGIEELKPLNGATAPAQNGAATPNGQSSSPQPQSTAPQVQTSGSTASTQQQSAALPPPPQVNDVSSSNGADASAQNTEGQSTDNKSQSSSKKKKKKGLHKLNPF
jgi:outer membrane protein assembly factor BamD